VSCQKTLDICISSFEPVIAFIKKPIPIVHNIKNGNTESVREPKKSTKIGRNELCKCNSGKKYKKCCWEK